MHDTTPCGHSTNKPLYVHQSNYALGLNGWNFNNSANDAFMFLPSNNCFSKIS